MNSLVTTGRDIARLDTASQTAARARPLSWPRFVDWESIPGAASTSAPRRFFEKLRAVWVRGFPLWGLDLYPAAARAGSIRRIFQSFRQRHTRLTYYRMPVALSAAYKHQPS